MIESCLGRTHAECDTPGQPGSGICAEVPDGIADPGEVTNLRFTLLNATTTPQTGAARALTNLALGIRPKPESVACVKRGHVYIGSVPAGGFFTTPVGALSFVVDPAALSLPATMQIEITALADGLEGLKPARSVTLAVDADRSLFSHIPASCPGNPAANASGVLCEDFDSERNGATGFQFTRLPIGADPADPLRALGDPNDDVLGYTQGTAGSPTGTAALTCMDDAARGFATCVPVSEENDWHLHSPNEGPGQGYDPPNRPGIGAPDGGKAHSGRRSMHWGRHLDPTTTFRDSIRFRQVAAFVMDPPVNIGTATSLDFWHIMSVLDDESHGQPAPGTTFMGGQVQISLLGGDGRFERWRPLTPSFNGYNSLMQDTFGVCQFDPGDDDLPPTNETMCEQSPLWSDMGGVYTGGDCTVFPDPFGEDCGDITCLPGPGCTEGGSTGPGSWTRSAFDLSPFAGRAARLRWIGTTAGGWGFGTYRSPEEPCPGCPILYSYYEADDGWWIDDIKLTDLRVSTSITHQDPSIGSATCNSHDPLNCGAVAISIAGSQPGPGGRRLLGLDTLSQVLTIDARQSAAADDPGTAPVEGRCDFGTLQFRFSELDAAGAVVDVIAPFSPAAQASVAPSRDTVYRVEGRCSSDPTCAASQEVLVAVYTGDGNDINDVEVTRAPSSMVRWTARPQPPGIAGYDVFRYASAGTTGVDLFPGGIFAGSCFAANVTQAALGSLVTRADNGVPAADTTFMYQVSHSSQAAGAINPLGVRPAPGPHAGQLVMAGVACP